VSATRQSVDDAQERPYRELEPDTARMTDDLFDLGRVGRIAQALAPRRTTVVESRHRRRRSTSTGAIEQQLGHDPSSGS
jgi:hypothetical protein